MEKTNVRFSLTQQTVEKSIKHNRLDKHNNEKRLKKYNS